MFYQRYDAASVCQWLFSRLFISADQASSSTNDYSQRKLTVVDAVAGN